MNATAFYGSSVGMQTPFFTAIITSAQTMSGWTVIHFNSVTKDTLGAFNTSTYQYQPAIAGYYYCTAMVTAASPNSLYYVNIHKNGSETAGIGAYPGVGGGYLSTSIQVAGILYLNGTSDYIDCRANANGSVGVYDVGANKAYVNRFSAFLLHAGS